MSVLIIMLMEMARDRACAKKTYIQHHKNNTAMDTRREKETRSTQEHLEKDRGKRNKRTQIYVGRIGEGGSRQRQMEESSPCPMYPRA